ncbi:POK6 protein, partial [Leptocoma aspasia]|nr:POK6 protein [Leptocoma aspasia]
EGSPQIVELAAVVQAFQLFPQPFNLITDSAYVANVVKRLEGSVLKDVSNPAIFRLLSRLIHLVSHREQPFYVMYVRSHTDLPGFITKGNRRADALAAPLQLEGQGNAFVRAKISHQLHHQNAPGLVHQFHLWRDQARVIMATCPHCSGSSLPSTESGVNPRGLQSCELWQTDVTHIPQFGKYQYVHMSVDTFSGAVHASAHAGEKAGDARKYLLQAFSTLGVPRILKTDNSPAYTSKVFAGFLQNWGIQHLRGIQHFPTGQVVIERTHGTLKRMLERQRED